MNLLPPSPSSALSQSENPWGSPLSSPALESKNEDTSDASDSEFQDVDLPSRSPSPSQPDRPASSQPSVSSPPPPIPSSASSSSRPLSKGPPPTLNRGIRGETETSGSNFDLSLKSPEGFNSFAAEGVVLAVLLVNFNHLLGPVIEFSHPPGILSSPSLDPELSRLLPFLALPDGAHLSDEDYSYFHTVSNPQDGHPPRSIDEEPFPISTTVFGISCNRQLPSSELHNRPSDVTRSTVQMAVVVLARQPVFGPIRDKLGVVTRAFFAQRDFTKTDILVDFYSSLQSSLRGQVSETTMHMGTSLRELIHKFRHKTLVLLKLMLLQKKIMFFGYPVERLCTYQYTLVSLIPGLLMSLNDCGSPTLDTFASSVEAPTSLKTSDRPSLLRFFGFPLNIFGKDAFFQPYLPLQQIDMCKCSSWLLGTTNSIMLQQRDAAHDCLANIEHTTFDFADPKLERLVALTAADRRWMDDVVRTVEETWNPEDPTRPIGMVFRGSDDFLRAKFEEYLCSLLSSMKYADFLANSPKADPIIGSGGGTLSQSISQFSTPWVKEFRNTTAFQTWDKVTDPVLFDIWEPKHPCDGKANAVTDIGLRLAEGLHDLNLEQNLAPTREALTSAFTSGSSTFLRAFEGVRSGISSQLAALPTSAITNSASPSFPAPGGGSGFPRFASRSSSASHPLSDPKGAGGAGGGGVDLRAAVAGLGSFWGAKMGSRFGGGSGVGAAAEKKVVEEERGQEMKQEEAREEEEAYAPVDLDARREAAGAGR